MNSVLKSAVAAALIPEYESMIPEISEEHVFSDGFKKKMKKLINRREKPYFRLINTVGKRAACIAVCVIVAFAATMNISAVKNAVLKFFEKDYFDRYISETVQLPAKTEIFAENLNSPQGILCREKDVLIVDSVKNCIYRYGYDGKLLGTIGEGGDGDLQFSKPTDITEHDGEIYVIDGLNDRIQVLNKRLKFVREIPLPKLSHMDTFISIAINSEGKIFLSGMFLEKNADRVYCIDSDGSNRHAVDNTSFVGVLYSDGENVYAINSAKNYSDGEDIYQKESTSTLYRVTENSMEQIFEFENIYTPRDFIYGEKILISSYTNRGAAYTDKDGSYLGNILDLEDKGNNVVNIGCIAKAPDGSVFFSIPDLNAVYRITE